MIHLIHSLIAPVESNECMTGAIRIVRIMRWLMSQDERKKIFNIIIKTFSHSASCNKRLCCLLCIMFRKVRLHMYMCRQPCHVLRYYIVLLKLHVKTCTSDNCGMGNCPELRKLREGKNKTREELENEKMMLEEVEKEKKEMWRQIEKVKKIREQLENKLDDIVMKISSDIEESPKKRRFSFIEEEVDNTPPVKKVNNYVKES